MVTISCSGLPPASNCKNIVPNPVATGSSTQMTIATTARASGPGAGSQGLLPPMIYGGGTILAALFLLAMGMMKESRRRRLAFGLVIAFAVTSLALQIGCGKGFGGSGTPAGNYRIIIVGQSGALNHSTKVQLVVQ